MALDSVLSRFFRNNVGMTGAIFWFTLTCPCNFGDWTEQSNLKPTLDGHCLLSWVVKFCRLSGLISLFLYIQTQPSPGLTLYDVKKNRQDPLFCLKDPNTKNSCQPYFQGNFQRSEQILVWFLWRTYRKCQLSCPHFFLKNRDNTKLKAFAMIFR